MQKETIFIMINSLASGGAERVVSQVLPGLSKKYHVCILLFRHDIFYNIPKEVTILSLSRSKNTLIFLLTTPLLFIKLLLIIKKYKPCKIISFLEIANFINILINRNAVISFRTSLFFFESGIVKKIHRLFIRILYPHAKKIIINSQENALNVHNELRIPKEKIVTILNPIDRKMIEQLSLEKIDMTQFPKNKKVFITIGRFDEQKNIQTLIDLFTDHVSNNSILLIIGSGPQEEKFSKIIHKRKLEEKIFLLGREKNVFPYLKYADYFLFSSKAEGFPNVLIEAMTCKLPIITSDFKTGAREIIDSNLSYDQKINYPHYGPNGVLISINNFKNDFKKINLSHVTQKQSHLKEFEIAKINKEWEEALSL